MLSGKHKLIKISLYNKANILKEQFLLFFFFAYIRMHKHISSYRDKVHMREPIN